jgi:hypothetical protein
MSAATFLHTGFTGTQLCGDPQRDIFTVFLTNRVYPSALNVKIHDVRQHFNSAVVGIMDKFKKNQAQKTPFVKDNHVPYEQ